jgi:hypothetical protein
MCLALGGRAGSTELRSWAQQELQGYAGDASLPDYRRVPTPLRIDGVQGNQIIGGAIIRGQRISPRDLPDPMADHLDEEVELRQTIGEIEQLADAGSEGSVRLSPPMGADIVRLMNHERADPLAVITELYWDVSRTALRGVVDQVRTALVALVAEIRAGLPDDAQVPSSALADRAVHVVVHGDKNRVVTTAANAGGGATASASALDEDSGSPFKRAAWWIVGVATVAGAAFAGWQVLAG